MYREQGKPDLAAEHYREGLTLYQDLQDPRSAARCLQGLAGVALMLAHARRAVRLSGATATIRAALGVQLPAFGRARYEEIVEAARVVLGDDTFDIAWVDGQALTFEQAIAEALSDESPA